MLISDDVDEAARRLAAGGLVAIPTETVYGLAANAEDDEAVARIFAVKGRPSNHPLIVHLATSVVDDIDRDHDLSGWTTSISAAARNLAIGAWPGPLTMLLPAGRRVHPTVTGGRTTVGLRVPSHPLTQALLDRTGFGLAAPSANRFGRVSPTTADHVAADLDGLLDPARDMILDGGPSTVGVESTIVDLTVDPPQILRAGAITADEVARLTEQTVAATTGPSRASGMLTSHYAPTAQVVVVDSADEAAAAVATEQHAGRRAAMLDRTDDLVVAARHLYDDLRDADRRRLDVLVVVQPPATGLGVAIRDRLSKAASERPSRAD